MAMSEWPKKRINEIRCSLCDAPTLDAKGVCGSCRRDFELGKALLAALDTDQKRPYYVPQYTFDYNWREPGQSFQDCERFFFAPALATLLGMPIQFFATPQTEVKPGGETYKDHRGQPRPEYWVNPDTLLYVRNGTHTDGPYAKLMLTPLQATVIKQMYRAIRAQIDEAYTNGYRSGSSLLVRIAEGDITVTEMNRGLAVHDGT